MATLAQAFRTRTIADATIGGLIDTRFYYRQAQQTADRPYCVYRRIASERHSHLSGGATIESVSYEVTCVADTPDACSDLIEAIKDHWDSYAGNVTVGVDTVSILSSRIDSDLEDQETPEPGRESGLFTATVDIDIKWRIAAPVHA